MNATVTKIVNNADNQNVVYDSSGILCRAYDDLTATYDLCQSRWINSGLYITDDGWQTVKAAIGKYIYVNPETGNEVTTMGVIGDTIVGKLIIGENLGIYNTNNSMTFNSDGLTITNGTNTFIVNPNDEKLFRITKSSNDVLWADKNGNLNLTGNITGSSITGGKIYGTTISGAEVSSSSFIGGNINIGDDNFIVDAGGNITSKGVLNLANGGVTYNSKDGLKVTGTINANGGTFSNTITCTGTISGGIIKASQFLANKFKATSDGNAYMISPYISSSIYMTGLGDFDDNSNYKEVIGSTFIHGVFYPILSGKWYANDLFASSFHIDAGDGYGVNITNSEISIVPFSVGSATSKINSKGIETTGNITCLGTINGNSSTATKLKTPRTLTIGRAGRVFDGSDNIGWTLADIGAATQNEVNSLKSRIEALEGRINS